MERVEQQVQPARRWPCSWYVFAVLAVVAVCVVPEAFPVPPSASDSYVFQFNNRVALPLLLFLVAAGTVITRGFGIFLEAAGAQGLGELRRRDLWGALAVTIGFGLLLLAMVHTLGGMNESTYLVDRARLAAAGLRPYRDFEFSYGALLVYGPVAVARLLRVSVVAGYWIFWLLNCVASTALLYRVVSLTSYATRWRRLIFWFFAVVAVLGMLCTGTNYTFVRFAMGPWFGLEMQRSLHAGAGERPRYGRAVFLAYAGTLTTLLISPEMGLAFFAGALLWLALQRHAWTIGRAVALVGFAVAALATFALAGHFQYFELMRVMSRGGSNEPYMPAPHMLILFACMAACAAWLRFRWLAGDVSDAVSALIVVSVPALASALGRCDPGHVFWGAFGILLAGWLLLSRTRAGGWLTAAFLVTFLVLPQMTAYVGLRAYGKALSHTLFAGNAANDGVVARSMERVAALALGREQAQRKLAFARAAANMPEQIDFPRTYPGTPLGSHPEFAAPLSYLPNTLSEYEGPEVFEGRYFGMQNVLAPAQVQAKVDELRAYPNRDLLMPKTFTGECGSGGGDGGLHAIRMLFAFPYTRRARHVEDLGSPFCQYVASHYRQAVPAAPSNFGYSLWVPLEH